MKKKNTTIYYVIGVTILGLIGVAMFLPIQDGVFGARTRIRIMQNATWTSDLIPQTDSTLDIGTTDERVADIWFDYATGTNSLAATQICIGASCRTTWPAGGSGDWATTSEQNFWNTTSTWAGFDGQFQTFYNATTTLSGFTDDSSNWDTAYGWGDHSTAGYTGWATSSTDFWETTQSRWSTTSEQYFWNNTSTLDLTTLELTNLNSYWGSDCAASNYAYGINADGSLDCRADETGGGGGALGWAWDSEKQLLIRSTTTEATLIGGSATTSATAIFEIIGETVMDTVSMDNATSTGWFYITEDLTVAGNLNGNVVGNLTGDVTGTVTGDLTCTNCLNATEIEDIYLLTAGDTSANAYTWTGAHNFDGGSLEIPQDDTIDAAGEIQIDTTSDTFRFYGASQRVVPYWNEKCFTMASSTWATGFVNIPLWHPAKAITVTDVYCETDGGTSIAVTLSDGTNVLESITCDEDGAADDGSITNGAFTANERFEVDLSSITGAVNYLNVCVTYDITAD